MWRAIALACTMARHARDLVYAPWGGCGSLKDCTSPVDVFERCVDVAYGFPNIARALKRPKVTGFVCFMVGLITLLRYGRERIERVAKQFVESAG